jgi:hypothetical protein
VLFLPISFFSYNRHDPSSRVIQRSKNDVKKLILKAQKDETNDSDLLNKHFEFNRKNTHKFTITKEKVIVIRMRGKKMEQEQL